MTLSYAAVQTVNDIAEVLRIPASDIGSYGSNTITLNNAQARRLLALATREPLAAAYHALFDFKDTKAPGSAEAVAAYEVLSAMHQAFELLGIVPPVRYDNPSAR